MNLRCTDSHPSQFHHHMHTDTLKWASAFLSASELTGFLVWSPKPSRDPFSVPRTSSLPSVSISRSPNKGKESKYKVRKITRLSPYYGVSCASRTLSSDSALWKIILKVTVSDSVVSLSGTGFLGPVAQLIDRAYLSTSPVS